MADIPEAAFSPTVHLWRRTAWRLTIVLVSSAMVGGTAPALLAQQPQIACAPATCQEPIESAGLPPLDCVLKLRSARILHMRGEHQEELELLRQTLEVFSGELAPIEAFLAYHREHPLADEEYRGILRRLSQRLDDPDATVPLPIMRLWVNDPAVSETVLSTTADHLERRLPATLPEAAASGAGASEAEQADLLDLLADVRQRQGNVEGAITALERLRQVRPSDRTGWPLYVLYRRTERWPEALDVYRDLMASDESGDQMEGVYIQLLGKAGQFVEQQKEIDAFLDRLAESQEVGEFQGQPSQVSDLDPPSQPSGQHERPSGDSWEAGLIRRIAWNLRDAGQDERAEALFRRLVELFPDDLETQHVVVHIYGSAEERASLASDAESRWQDETDINAIFNEGTQRLTAGDAEGAIELLRRAATGFGDLEAAWYNLGMAAYRLKDWTTAETAFARASELNPERAESLFFRGIALDSLERCQEAIPVLDKALALDPGRHLAHYYLYRCHLTRGDTTAAERHRALYDASQ